MGKTIITIIAILTSLFNYCQEGVTVPLNHPNKSGITNGTYISDLNDDFIPYIGTWQGTWNDKVFTLKIEKIPHFTETYPNGDYYYRDILIGNYIVTDLSGELELANSLAITDPDLAKIRSMFRPFNNYFSFNYSNESLCSVRFIVNLSRNLSNPNELIYSVGDRDYWEEEGCPYESINDIPVPIPTSLTSPLILTKIN